MWADQPNWTDDQLKAIDTPILVVDGASARKIAPCEG